jgi:ubiquinone/menaquinone biosynthesis C-methylase UbiE
MSAGPSGYADPEFARRYLAASAKAEDRGAREHRRRLLTGIRGTVCEVGAGHGVNFAHYPAGVEKVVAVEPEPTLRGHAVTAAQHSALDIDVVDGNADRLPLPDASCDAVVASLVLCSVPDQDTALAEIRRVLRPGGHLHFYEHVRSGRRAVAWLQHAIAPMWGHFAGGCHPDRDTVGALRANDFRVSDLDTFAFSPVRGVPPFAHVIGRAVRTSQGRQSG